MVCSPHRYIVADVARGLRYESGVSLTYQTPAYSGLSAKRYEQQKLSETTYNPQTKNEQQETITAKNNWYRYDESKNNTPFVETEQTITTSPVSYIPLRPRQFIFNQEPFQEAPMTNQDIKQTKQKLAQLIMNELDSLGPREEHTHEHGEHAHVH